jgi:hypothetical protein
MAQMTSRNKIILLSILLCISLDLTLAADPTPVSRQNVWDRQNLGAQNIFFTNWGRYNRYTDIIANEQLFYPVEPWEIEVCTKDLSSDVTLNLGDATPSGLSNGALYSDIATVQAYRRTPLNATIDNKYLYEISWYFHPQSANMFYYINITGPSGEEVVIDKGRATSRAGDFSYKALYSNSTYNKVKIKYKNSVIDNIPIIIK